MEEVAVNAAETVDFEGRILSEDDIHKKVEELRKKICDNNKLEELRTDDAYLLRFLYSCKFDVQHAYKKMDNFYELLVEYPEWFHNSTQDEAKSLLEKNMRLLMPDRDREGRLVFLAKIGNVNPSKVTIKEVMRLDDMWLDIAVDDRQTQRKGLCVLVDVSGYSVRLLQWLTPGNLKFGVKKLDLLPFSEYSIHVVNTSFLMEASVKIVWPFLPSKYKEAVKFHYDNWESLHKYIHPSNLPPEYGGTGPSINYEKLNQRILDNYDKIQENNKFIKFIVSGK